MSGSADSELESEFEQELESETESENFSFGDVLGGLLGEGETTTNQQAAVPNTRKFSVMTSW